MKVKIEGIIIGEREFKHTIEVPNHAQEMRDIQIMEFLEKQYPGKVKKMCDIKSEVIE